MIIKSAKTLISDKRFKSFTLFMYLRSLFCKISNYGTSIRQSVQQYIINRTGNVSEYFGIFLSLGMMFFVLFQPSCLFLSDNSQSFRSQSKIPEVSMSQELNLPCYSKPQNLTLRLRNFIKNKYLFYSFRKIPKVQHTIQLAPFIT